MRPRPRPRAATAGAVVLTVGALNACGAEHGAGIGAVCDEFHLDLGLLTERLVGATDWLARKPETQELKIGYFGAGLGAAAALIAAAARQQVSAVVARGGKPEPAELALPNVKAPTLFILGEHDAGLLPATRLALDGIKAPGKLEIVPGASHLFEEDGALELMAGLAADWFRQHCAA